MTRSTNTQLGTELPHVPSPVLKRAHGAITSWFAAHARDLPWRRPGTTAWGVLVSEVMSQQTPMSRVAPRWEAWMARWPEPADLAAAPTAEVLKMWDTLGYPRRALRLQECAAAVAALPTGRVPDDIDELLALPGIGTYTAAAVASFAYGQRVAVLDVNIRRVLARAFRALEHPKAALSKLEQAWALELVPRGEDVPGPPAHVAWNAGLMELGALVCTSRNPDCAACPLAADCTWLRAGRPAAPAAHKPKTQAWAGTDRQLRGAIMAVLRQAGPAPVPVDLFTAPVLRFDPTAMESFDAAVQKAIMRVRELGNEERTSGLIADLVSDGLARVSESGITLP
ncbi:A/G-specific adenine glycosylase [Brevibacterium sp. 50QC2O2]|uniref:A/G-specific adenine glycosylase n=1 Tax=Brevibacterium sp. 50QC2O2 TaxID=2968459 RepID=UPI00211BAA24|nr:A/G-specific adenine glycosylase [Brevibacterium sp. 50QC2O2]MCQ9387315.1 A/G-specific adenine glycosylase [Brevibacterium sp. 50QC2O2]